MIDLFSRYNISLGMNTTAGGKNLYKRRVSQAKCNKRVARHFAGKTLIDAKLRRGYSVSDFGSMPTDRHSS